jgi:hypothetical protein
MTTNTNKFVAACLFGLATSVAHADRHGVQFTDTVERGQCEVEVTYDRDQSRVNGLETEVGCGVGPLQLGGEWEHVRERPSSKTTWALEAKWAHDINDKLKAGLFVRSQWQAHQQPRYDSTSLVALASYELRDNLDLHLNLGHEFVHCGSGQARSGIALEWRPRPGWGLLAERYVQEETHYVRAGVRWTAKEPWSVELGRAQRIAGPERSLWILSIARSFGG